jgi:RsiW-degrading membrane proteinase PrsW (M82 family)
VLGPALILVAETVALVAAVLVVIVWATSQPELMKAFMAISQEVQSGRASSDELVRSLGPYLLRPGILFGVLVFASLIVPLIEELIKPIGVWLLFGRPMTAAAGLAAGAISGAGYAFFESLALTSNGQDWALSVVSRSGTAVIHIFTASLMGWALVLAWRERRYLRLLGTYALAVLIHGSWNALALLNAAGSLSDLQAGAQKSPLLSQVGALAPYGLIIMTVAALVALLWVNRRLRPAPDGLPALEQPSNPNPLE